MRLRVRAIQRDPGVPDPAFFDPAGDIRRYQRTVRTERHPETAAPGMGHELPDIRAHQRLAAGEEDERDSRIREIVDDPFRL